MATALERFRAVVPAYSALSDEAVTAWIEIAQEQLDAATWGTLYASGSAYLAAHLIESTPGVSGSSGLAQASGPVASRGSGGESVSYAAPSVTIGMAENQLRSTVYGGIFLMLRESLGDSGPGIVTIL